VSVNPYGVAVIKALIATVDMKRIPSSWIATMAEMVIGSARLELAKSVPPPAPEFNCEGTQ